MGNECNRTAIFPGTLIEMRCDFRWIIRWFGGDKIAEMLDELGNWVSSKTDNVYCLV